LPPGAICPTDGTALPARAEASTSAPAIDGFTVGERLGGGGFAEVYAARAADGSEVALKVARVASPLARERFVREADALARIGPPRVPTLVACGDTAAGRPYLALELVPGEPVSRWLERLDRPMPAREAVALIDAIAAALEVAHAAGCIHRDLKPENVILTPDEQVVLIDFGAVRRSVAGGRTTTGGWVVGTSIYMAPEQLAGGDLTGAVDLYAAGVMLYECLTGCVPFFGDVASVEHAHRLLRPRRPSELAPVPRDLDELVMACLAKDPARRPASAAALREALAGVELGTLSQSASSTTTRLGEETRPVVLLAVEGAPLGPDVADAVRAGRGLLARHYRRGFVCAFCGDGDDDPATSALGLARELVSAHGARAVAHLSELHVRDGHRGRRVYGVEVDHPEAWLPPVAWAGFAVTSALADALPETRADDELPGFARVVGSVSPRQQPPLIGRDSLLADLAAETRAALAAGSSLLATVIGGRGTGKSRLAGELVGRVPAALPGARVVAGARELPGDGPVAPRLIAAARRQPLALIVDDAHRADDALLDALELATLEGHLPLVVIAIAEPRLEARRPHWGQRAHRAVRHDLPPLSVDDAMALAAALLFPAEYVPADGLRRLAEWAGGNPFLLSEAVARLKREGALQRRPRADSFYLDAAYLDRLPTSPAAQWIAVRELDAMEPELAACARVCAVLGASFDRDELARVIDGAARAGLAATAVDADAGLREIARRGLLVDDGDGRWRFARPLLCDALYRALPAGDRTRLHGLAFDYWRRGDGADADRALAAAARHAAGSGHVREAAERFVRLGDRRRARHQFVAAEEAYNAALEREPIGELRWRALLGRGAVRYRIQRIDDAVADLRAARAAALSPAMEARALLEEATALDWGEDFAASAARVDEARPLVEAAGDPALEARLRLGEGRSRWRAEDPHGAAALLEQACARARELGDAEIEIIAGVTLGPPLVFAGRMHDAAACFERVIELAEREGDRFHLCGAYSNRLFLWRNQPDAAEADLRRAVALAREIGQPILERVVSHNLSELLYWQGRIDEALPLARRGRLLQERFLPAPVADDALLLARVTAAAGAAAEARDWLDWVDANVPDSARAPSDRVVSALLSLVIDREAAADRWDAVLGDARAVLAPEELLEALHWAVIAGAPDRREALLAEARELAADHPIWRRRFAADALQGG